MPRRVIEQSKEPQDLDELAWQVISMINGYRAHAGSQPTKVVGFAWELRYGEVPNTHEAPAGRRTNWGRRDPDAPTSYPGWQGRVWIRYSDDYQGHGSDPFRGTLTYTGTGGAGSYSGPFERIASRRFRRYGHDHGPDTYPEPQVYSWDYRLFEDDWPGVRQWREREAIMAALQRPKQGWDPTHRFEWWDPEIRAQDDAFLKEPETIYAAEMRKSNMAL